MSSVGDTILDSEVGRAVAEAVGQFTVG
jgi:hypothetical protein